MKHILLAVTLLAVTTFSGCSVPKPIVKEKIVYKTQIEYVYIPCKKSYTKKKSKRTSTKQLAKINNQHFKLPKKTVKFFAPEQFTTRENKTMDFMVGYNRDGSKFLYLEGEFGTDTYNNFLKYIKQSTTPFHEIKIDSNGGVVATAMQIGAYVYDHKWSTGVDKEMHCFSACGFVYFAGKEKFLQGKSVVGLHRPYIPGIADTKSSIHKVKREYISYWNYIKAPKSVYDEMMTVDRDSLFMLNKDNINDYIDVTLQN